MTSEERLSQLQTMREEFEHPACTLERRIEIATKVREFAVEEGMRNCINCGKALFHIPFRMALIEGHVFSEDGAREVSITGMCEWCWDKIMANPDDIEEEAWNLLHPDRPYDVALREYQEQYLDEHHDDDPQTEYSDKSVASREGRDKT
jgi:hypothetical protein